MNQGYFLADKILNDYPDKAVLHWFLCISCCIFCVLHVFGCFYQGEFHNFKSGLYRPIVDKYYFSRIIFLPNSQLLFLPRRDGRAVECGGLENRWPKRSGGSNPSLSAGSGEKAGNSRKKFFNVLKIRIITQKAHLITHRCSVESFSE